MRAYLSVDFDFFVRSLGEWDWGHQESPFFQEGAMWTIRASDFLQRGLDLRDEMDPETYALPRPGSFWSILEGLGYDLSGVSVFVVADTHAGAAPIFIQSAQRFGAPDAIINFDAHHDVGYIPWRKLRKIAQAGECRCDTWLCSVLCALPQVQARIIFPDWLREGLTLEEEIVSIHNALPRRMWRRVLVSFFTTEDEAVSPLVSVPGEPIEVEAVYVCRSGAWVPPWLDEAFVDFISDGEEAMGIEAFPALYHAGQDVDPLEPRKSFSWNNAEHMAAQMRQLLAQHRDAQRRRMPEGEED